jgi:uncharacterized protein (DUF1800 family)
LPADPVAWLAAQLDGPDPALSHPGKTAAQGLMMLRRDRQGDGALKRVQPAYGIDTTVVLHDWLTTNMPFRERLVWFWANHFTVSLLLDSAAAGAEMMAVAPAFVREAIRPHVTGRFTDMLLAVMRHPAMLMYLANPHQTNGGDRPDLNERLARVSLERHTLTRSAGYAQQDVTEYARVLTGWSLDMDGPAPGFLFREDRHAPGEKTVMGHTYPAGETGVLRLLRWLGEHPHTYRNLAVKLARHFVADDPPASCVDRVATVLAYTGGDLRAAAMAVIALPDAWQPATKRRSPMDYVVAVLRAMEIRDYPAPTFHAALSGLGQGLFAAPTPEGWPDTAAEWSRGRPPSDTMEWIHRLLPHVLHNDPEVAAQQALGDLVMLETMQQMRCAESRQAALTLLLTAPEFRRR